MTDVAKLLAQGTVTKREVPPGTGRGAPPKYKFLFDLEVGQCFELDLGPNDLQNLRSAVSRYGKRLGRAFTLRQIDGAHYGVWRLPDA
jgi:hypothetical protein